MSAACSFYCALTLRLRNTFVFEPNDNICAGLSGRLRVVMHQLFVRGAFAGSWRFSYQVVTDDAINTADDFDQGRFRVDLKVAPA